MHGVTMHIHIFTFESGEKQIVEILKIIDQASQSPPHNFFQGQSYKLRPMANRNKGSNVPELKNDIDFAY